jgi:hypothetical protein
VSVAGCPARAGVMTAVRELMSCCWADRVAAPWAPVRARWQRMVAPAEPPADPALTVRPMNWPHADGELRPIVKKSDVVALAGSGPREHAIVVPSVLQFQAPT